MNKIKTLLNTSLIQGNAKLDKALKLPALAQYRTASLSMMPTLRICPGSKSAHCFDVCLKSAGRGAFSSVAAARQARTDYFESDQSGFVAQLTNELERFDKLCERTNKIGAVRLNVLSDIAFENLLDMEAFKHIKFFDYTKRFKRIVAFSESKLPSNYHLTFSYSAASRSYYEKCSAVIGLSNVNVAVVFRNSLPFSFSGRTVINGDLHDLRFLDQPGSIVGLLAKGSAKKDQSGFVVDA